jgi:DNA-binding transcriptional ArsR family regulator
VDEITILQAEVLKSLAHPRRLLIMRRLDEGPCDVGTLAAELGISQPNLSQHLAVLRSTGLVDAVRDGREIRYRLADADVITACMIMRRVLERRITRLAHLSAPAAEPPAEASLPALP